MKPKDQKRVEARDRQAAYNALSPKEKLRRVQEHIALGLGNAKRQLAKLTK